MREFFKKICVLLFCLSLSACAGGAGTSIPERPMEPNFSNLPDQVPESFHFTIQDKKVRQLLTGNPTDFSKTDQLQIVLLSEIANAETKKDLTVSLNRLWEKDDWIKKLTLGDEMAEEDSKAAVLLYFMLTADPESAWQRQTASKIYGQSLDSIQPEQLGGYPLHFYTLALLQVGKISEAMPYLNRLEQYTSPADYMADLSMALGYSLIPGDEELSIELMEKICQQSLKEDALFPDTEMTHAVEVLKQFGKIEEVRAAISPSITSSQELKKYQFVKILAKNKDKEKETWYQKSKSDDKYGEISSLISNDLDLNTNAYSQVRGVEIEVQVIVAGGDESYLDPALESINDNLKDLFNYSSFRLLSQKDIGLLSGEKGVVEINSDHHLQVVLRSLKEDRSLLDVAIYKGSKKVLSTEINSIDGGVTIIGGPQTKGGRLLLRLTTLHAGLKA